MLRSIAILLCFGLMTAACGGFSRQDPNTLVPEGGYTPEFVDNRPLVQEIVALDVERTPGGIILSATGLPPTQGYWDTSLVRDDRADIPASTIQFSFRARPPVTVSETGTRASREVHVGTFISEVELRGVRRLTVVSATNTRSRNR